MLVHHATLQTCAEASGTVVVIDVLRAFTTAAFALAAGASEVVPVATVEEAFAWRERDPATLLTGEVEGVPIPGFDVGNSPAALDGADLRGRRVVQRTTAGTQGLVRSVGASLLLASSFVCAAATVRLLRAAEPEAVTFVITGARADADGDEDAACADYLAALLDSGVPAAAPYLARVGASMAGRRFGDPERPELPRADLDRCVELDRFDFALVAHRLPDRLSLRPVPAPR